MRTLDLAKGRWSGIFRAIGVPMQALNGKHQQCPVCGQGKDTFRIVKDHELGQWFCNYCDPTNNNKLGLDFVKMFLNIDTAEALKRIDEILGNGVEKVVVKEKKSPRRLLNYILSIRREPERDVLSYLKSRGLEPTRAIKQATLTYWHEGKKMGNYEAMVCRIVAHDNKPESFHITYLENGRKAKVPMSKKVMTPMRTITGGAIRLFKPSEILGIAEGVETALSCSKMFKIPVWSVVTANGMENFIPPNGVRKLVIFADNDESFTGQASAYICAKINKARGLDVEVKTSVLGDFNDDLMDLIESGRF